MEAPGIYPPASDDTKPGDDFTMEDLLDFTHGDEDSAVADVSLTGSMFTAVESCTSGDHVVSANIAGNQSAGELSVPYDDLAELEWLSNFVEESFSSEDVQKFPPLPETRESKFGKTDPEFRPDPSVPGKARSKRSRAATCNWSSSSVLVVSPEASVEYSSKASRGEKSSADYGRRCTHCATEKTPQWRTGPMGPKTLCNACGVRYKSGRLVPEYRPAASPTFVLTKHSNSHRKVLELRRQKELLMAQQQQQQDEKLFNDALLFDALTSDDYLIDQPQFTRLI